MQTSRLSYIATLLFVPAAILAMSLATTWRVNAAPAEPYFVTVSVSINALMVALVDHAAHEIWDGASADVLSEREWQNLEQHTIQLAASGSLISVGGTGTADYGRVMSPGWQQWARRLTDAALESIEAVRNRDRQALVAAGESIRSSCEGCHEIFQPSAPTEGMVHIPYYD